MTTVVRQDEVDIQILLYTGLFQYKEDITIDGVGEEYVITYNSDGEAICEEIESHVELAGDYSSVTSLMLYNVSKELENAISHVLDAKAVEYRYDDMKSVRSYTGFDNKFQAECINLATWGASCWEVVDQVEADVRAGLRGLPTVNELLAELPEYQV